MRLIPFRALLPAMLALALLSQPGALRGEDASGEGRITSVHLVEEGNWPPFTPDKYGDVKEGLSYELMHAIFSRLDIEIDLELLPMKRLLAHLANGDKDAATMISVNSERMLTLEFTKPMLHNKEFAYFLADRKPPFEWNGFESLKGLRIGVTAGHNYGDEFIDAIARLELNIEKVNTEEQNFKKLVARRIDVLLCNEAPANEIMRRLDLAGKIIHVSKPYYIKDYSIAFSKKSPAKKLIPEVNAVIKRMKEDGSIEAIISKHIPQKTATADSPENH